MKLEIREHGKLVKTYTADAYDLTFGTVEDILDALNIDELQKGDDTELVKMALKFVSSNMPLVRDLMKDIFDGITDEEIRRAKAKDVAVVLIQVVKYAFAEIRKGVTAKN